MLVRNIFWKKIFYHLVTIFRFHFYFSGDKVVVRNGSIRNDAFYRTEIIKSILLADDYYQVRYCNRWGPGSIRRVHVQNIKLDDIGDSIDVTGDRQIIYNPVQNYRPTALTYYVYGPCIGCGLYFGDLPTHFYDCDINNLRMERLNNHPASLDHQSVSEIYDLIEEVLEDDMFEDYYN